MIRPQVVVEQLKGIDPMLAHVIVVHLAKKFPQAHSESKWQQLEYPETMEVIQTVNDLRAVGPLEVMPDEVDMTCTVSRLKVRILLMPVFSEYERLDDIWQRLLPAVRDTLNVEYLRLGYSPYSDTVYYTL